MAMWGHSKYDISRHRQPAGETVLAWPEKSGDAREFIEGIMMGSGANENPVYYSYGPEWHRSLVPGGHSGFLTNCYYRVNSDGMHWDEYVREPDILAVGCSVTAGVGLPYEFTWPNILRHVAGYSVNNVARPGASINTMVKSVVHHMKHYGIPKRIFMFIPDPMRYVFTIPAGFVSGYRGPRKEVLYWNDEQNLYSDGAHPFIWDDGSGVPHVPSPHFLVDANLHSLEILGYLCDLMNIDLVLNLNANPHVAQFQTMGYNVTQNLQIDMQPPNRYLELFWKFGWDFVEGNSRTPHPGAEAHILCAGEFLQRPIKKEEIDTLSCWYHEKLDYTAKRFEG